jgi:outer membrane protein assembly factor BamA
VLNQESRYPLFWVFDGVSFVDVGNVFPRVSYFKLRDRWSAGGFGLRIRNPFVVLWFAYGFKFGGRPGETMEEERRNEANLHVKRLLSID